MPRKMALKRVVSVDPFDGQAHSVLGRMALTGGDTPEAIRLFRVALAAKPLDKAGAHADLAEALLKAGQRDEARKQVMEALMIAPTFSRAQDLLLKLSVQRNTRDGGRLAPRDTLFAGQLVFWF